MVSENNGPTTRRIAASGDVEVSTYLEIAEEREEGCDPFLRTLKKPGMNLWWWWTSAPSTVAS